MSTDRLDDRCGRAENEVQRETLRVAAPLRAGTGDWQWGTVPIGKSSARSDRSCQAPPVITEHAVLEVLPDRTDEFEAAFVQARAIISHMLGFRSLHLGRCIEVPSRYLLLVEWNTLEDHTEGFRKSSEYEQWKALLHRYYDPFPTVDHYEVVLNG